MERHLKALLIALALLSLYALPATAQNGSITINLNCYDEPEGVTITNDTDGDIVFTGITSSFEAVGDPERAYNLTIASGDTATAPIGDESAGGSDNIFNDEEVESATVYVADDFFYVSCDAVRTVQVGGGVTDPTAVPEPGESPEPEPTKMMPTMPDKAGAGASRRAPRCLGALWVLQHPVCSRRATRSCTGDRGLASRQSS